MARLRVVVALIALVLGVVPAAGAATGNRQGALPLGWKELAWHGVRIRYDPRVHRFASIDLPDGRARAAARLGESEDICPYEGADCFPAEARFYLYPAGGLDVHTWAMRNTPALAKISGDTVVSGRHALRSFTLTDGVGHNSLSYVIPLGVDMLVIHTGGIEDIASRLQFTQPFRTQLAAGQAAMTKPGRALDLWTRAAGGARVYERPLLYGGTPLTILGLRSHAVQVRTSEGVTGWLHAPAEAVLTPQAASVSPRARFQGVSTVQVVHLRPIPLRDGPSSTAPKIIDRILPGQQLSLMGVRGDWMRVLLFAPDGGYEPSWAFGWVRWHYDGARYVDVAP